MEFDRAFTVAVKIFVVDFSLCLIVIWFLFPFALLGLPQRIISIVIGAALGLFGLAVAVYFLLKETEKISSFFYPHYYRVR